MTSTRSSNRTSFGAPTGTLTLAVLVAVMAVPVEGARFGVPSPSGEDPPGYLVLVSKDAVSTGLSDAFGDVARELTFYIEVASRGLVVDLYDPGLYFAAGPADQLDVNLDPAGGSGTMRYVLFDPDLAILADATFGPDDPTTDRTLVRLYRDGGAREGVYQLLVMYIDEAGFEQDLSVFGLSVPGHAVYTLNLTAGHVNMGGATISEPVSAYPYLVAPSAGTDPVGPVCGVDFHSYDLEAALNGVAPPETVVTTPRGYTFAPGAFPPSGDGRFWKTEMAGIPWGLLDSDDHGLYRWDFSGLGSIAETLFENIAPLDVNVFSIQVLDYGVAERDFRNWPVLPPVLDDNPRRIYLPADDGAAPAKEAMGHAAVIVDGWDPITQDESTTVEVTLSIRNPNPYPLTDLDGTSFVAPDPEVSDPSMLTATGVIAAIDGADPRRINLSGEVAAGSTAEVRYRLTLDPTTPGPRYLTGDETDFLSATAPTVLTYRTPYTRRDDPSQELGPICMIEYEVAPHPCVPDAVASASETLVCPGTEVVLDSAGSSVAYCPGGEAIYQWRVNGDVFARFPAPATVTVEPYLDGTYTLEVMCSTEPSCIAAIDLDVATYPELAIDAGSDMTACLGTTVDLTATPSGGTPPYGAYAWSTTPPGQPGDGATTAAITIEPTVTTTYTFRAADALACEGTDSVTITVPQPDVEIRPDAPELCPGETVELAGSPGFAGYLWQTTPPGLAGDGETTSSIVAADVGVDYTVTATDADGCSDVDTVTTAAVVDVVPGPLGSVLMIVRSGTVGMELSWPDLPAPAGEYQIVSLDCDRDLDGVCDVVPLASTLAAQPFARVAAGLERLLLPTGLERPSHLVFYRIRAASVCYLSQGPV